MADAGASLSELAAARQRIEALAASEAALIEVRSSYQSLYDMLMHAQAPVAMWRGDDFVFTLANPHYCAVLPDRTFLGRPLLDVLPEAKQQGFWDLLEQVYRTGEPFVGNEMPVTFRDSETGREEQHWLNIVYAPVRDRRGEIVGVCHFGVEITDQVRARHAAEARADERRRSAELIAAQQETIRVMSTPLLPLADGVLAIALGDRCGHEREVAAGAPDLQVR